MSKIKITISGLFYELKMMNSIPIVLETTKLQIDYRRFNIQLILDNEDLVLIAETLCRQTVPELRMRLRPIDTEESIIEQVKRSLLRMYSRIDVFITENGQPL